MCDSVVTKRERERERERERTGGLYSFPWWIRIYGESSVSLSEKDELKCFLKVTCLSGLGEGGRDG